MKLFALIGFPLEHSTGPLFHNAEFKRRNINAAYVKYEVKLHELKRVLPQLKKWATGLSVTMPLKEEVLHHVDHVDAMTENIGAANTLLIKNNQIYATNTDGLGALKALGLPSVRNRRVVVLGAGGTARAIVYMAALQGAKVFVLNRNVHKAAQLVGSFGALGAYPLITQGTVFHSGEPLLEFDVLISTLPFDASPVPLCLQLRFGRKCAGVFPGGEGADPLDGDKQIVMDVANTAKNSWLRPLAEKHGCSFMDRVPMFEHQALLQQEFWV